MPYDTRTQAATLAAARHQSRQLIRKSGAGKTVDTLITDFHEIVRHGPTYVCTSCDQLFYRHSVVKAAHLISLNIEKVSTTLLNRVSEDNTEWICKTCEKHLKHNKLPPMSIANNLQFCPIPDNLPSLTPQEWRLLSPRLVFMKIYEAPVGKQLKIHGNVVNVPSDVCTTVNMLPRSENQCETIALQLKRRSQYKHAFMSSNIRPACVRLVGKYLSENGKLFINEHITFSDELATALHSDNQTESDDHTESHLPEVRTSDPIVSNDDDDWVEKDTSSTNNEERAGIFDTLYTSDDFVEDTERSAVYNFAPAEKNRPVSIFIDKHCEELGFPNLFYGNARPEEHPVKIHYSDIVKSELRRSDRRVARCVDNMFFKLKKQQMIILSNHVNVAVRKRKTGGKTLTARQLRDQGGIDNLVQFDNGYRILKQVRGSPPYWESARKDLMAMIRQLGPATLFITFSAAETHWYHLLQLLSKLVDDKQLTDDECKELSWSEKCRLINSDPVTCSRHFHYSFNAFLNTFIKSPLSPFGRLKDHWYRVEFQHRGSPHIHMLLWIEDAPQYGTHDDKDVISYIDKIISCRRTWNDEQVDQLIALQVHRHTKTCKKQIKKKTVCRFGFPKYPMNETQILTPLVGDPSDTTDTDKYSEQLNNINAVLGQMKPDSDIHTMQEFLTAVGLDYDSYIATIRSSLKSDTVFLRRSPEEIRVNNYNIDVLKGWCANIDLQCILSIHACAAYITGYVAKTSRGMSDLLQKACKEAKEGDKNIKQQLRFIGNKFLNNVEVSAQEAVYLLLELPLKCSSRQVIFINTSVPSERVYLMKNNISELPDDVEIAAGNLISRYSKRHKSLETLTLADYAAWYDQPWLTDSVNNVDISEDDDSDETVMTEHKIRKRKHPRVIRFVKYNEKDTENYCREKLMLHTH